MVSGYESMTDTRQDCNEQDVLAAALAENDRLRRESAVANLLAQRVAR